MSSSNKSKTTVSFSASDVPKFDGRNFLQWKERITGVLLYSDVMDIIRGTLVEPPATDAPAPPAAPAANADATAVGVATYKFTKYQYDMQQYQKKVKDYGEKNAKALGILSLSLSFSIWNQVKDKSAKEAWDWLNQHYSKEKFAQVLEDFRYLANFKLDLSDPNPQIADFQHHYSRIPFETIGSGSSATQAPIVSQSMAALLWLNSLPLATGATSQESVYQRMMEKYTSDNSVHLMDLDGVFDATRSAWAARFGHLPSHQQPKKGTLYLKKDNRDQKQKAPNTQTAQRNTAIKGKGKEPSHSDQQNAGKSGSLQDEKKKPHRRGKKPSAKQAETSAVATTGFVLASPAIVSEPSRPAPTVHTITDIGRHGSVTTRQVQQSGPWRAPTRGKPYPSFTRSRTLMSRLGVTPTIETSKRFEEIAHAEVTRASGLDQSLETELFGPYVDPKVSIPLGNHTIQEPAKEPEDTVMELIDSYGSDLPDTAPTPELGISPLPEESSDVHMFEGNGYTISAPVNAEGRPIIDGHVNEGGSLYPHCWESDSDDDDGRVSLGPEEEPEGPQSWKTGRIPDAPSISYEEECDRNTDWY